MDIEKIIKNLTKLQHFRIVLLAVEHKIKLTENRNGFFINYSRLTEEQKKIILDFVENELYDETKKYI
jgi:stage III sporulation protein SpoIIIAA